MKLTNDSYLILIGTRMFTERYYRDKTGWLKVSARKRKFRMTAEQVLNHILPALAGVKPNLKIEVRHRSRNRSRAASSTGPAKNAQAASRSRPVRPPQRILR